LTFCQSRWWFLCVCNEWIMDHDLGSRDAAMIVRCSSFRCWSLSRLAFWHFRSLVPKPLHPGTPSPNFPHHMVLGISCGICGKVTPLNGSQMPSALHTRVCKFRKYPLSVSFVWDLFVPFFGALSACANLQNLKIKYNEKITKLLHPSWALESCVPCDALTILAPNSLGTSTNFHPTNVRFICFPERKKDAIRFKLRH